MKIVIEMKSIDRSWRELVVCEAVVEAKRILRILGSHGEYGARYRAVLYVDQEPCMTFDVDRPELRPLEKLES